MLIFSINMLDSINYAYSMIIFPDVKDRNIFYFAYTNERM